MTISNLRKSINYTFNNGLADSAIKAFTSGNLVTAFALALGANSVIIGLLQSVQPLANFVHLAVAYFIEKGAKLKKISFWCSLISRPFWLIAGCVAFFADSTIALYIFCISYFLAYFIATATGGAFWPWIKELVPHKIMNNFLAFRINIFLSSELFAVSLLVACFIWYKNIIPNMQYIHIHFYLSLLFY